MKRLCVLFIISLLLISFLALTITRAQEPPNLPINPENIENTKEQITTKWEYLGKEWRNILLNNPIIKIFDSLFTKISIVFTILFGMSYSLSLTLFFIILLWIFIAFESGKIVASWGIIAEIHSKLIGILISIILAQIRVLKLVVVFIGTMVFSDRTWLARSLIIISILLIVILLHFLGSSFAKWLKVRKKMLDEAKTRLAKKAEQIFSKRLRKS